MSSSMSHGIFGGKCPELQVAERDKRRKNRAEKEKEKKAKQATTAKHPFRNKKPEASSSGKDFGYSCSQQQKQNRQSYNQGKQTQNRQSSQSNKDKKPDNSKEKEKNSGVVI